MRRSGRPCPRRGPPGTAPAPRSSSAAAAAAAAAHRPPPGLLPSRQSPATAAPAARSWDAGPVLPESVGPRAPSRVRLCALRVGGAAACACSCRLRRADAGCGWHAAGWQACSAVLVVCKAAGAVLSSGELWALCPSAAPAAVLRPWKAAVCSRALTSSRNPRPAAYPLVALLLPIGTVQHALLPCVRASATTTTDALESELARAGYTLLPAHRLQKLGADWRHPNIAFWYPPPMTEIQTPAEPPAAP